MPVMADVVEQEQVHACLICEGGVFNLRCNSGCSNYHTVLRLFGVCANVLDIHCADIHCQQCQWWHIYTGAGRKGMLPSIQ